MRTCLVITGSIFALFMVLLGIYAWLYTQGSNFQRFYIYSPNEEHVITVISKDNNTIRYIIVGKHNNIPDSNYIKVESDRWKNYIDICWDKDGFVWKLINDKVTILENKLDQNIYHFTNEYRKDERGIPLRDDYTGDKCHAVSVIHYITVWLGSAPNYKHRGPADGTRVSQE